MARIGRVDGARQVADMLDPDNRILVYEAIAATRRDAGDAAGARTTLQAALDFTRRRLGEFDAAHRGREEPISAERNRLLASLGASRRSSARRSRRSRRSGRSTTAPSNSRP